MQGGWVGTVNTILVDHLLQLSLSVRAQPWRPFNGTGAFTPQKGQIATMIGQPVSFTVRCWQQQLAGYA